MSTYISDLLYFVSTDICPSSFEILLYSTITTLCCGRYGLLNLNFEESSIHLPDRVRAKPFAKQKVIELEDSSLTFLVTPISKAKYRGQGHGLATQVTMIPGLKLRYAEKERQNVNRCEIDRKSKSGFDSNVLVVCF